MNKRAVIGKALEYGLEVGGGAAAGYLEARYPGKTLWQGGPGLGAGVAAAGLALGIFGIGGRLGHWAGDIGAGAAAFEVGKMVAQKTTPASSAATSSVRGVGALPGGRPVSQQEIRQALRDLAHV